MYKKNNMLREKRKHANYKPNRRLDAKSSRGMIYENEELRIRTININAEVERGQSEIKTLKREREQLRREIWTLRDEYDKLENLLRIKGIDPDEFLNQKPNNNEDDDEDDENLSDCSECSCESCCGDDCRDEKAPNGDQKTDKGDGASNDQAKNEAGSTSTTKGETQTNSSKNSLDEHNKRPGKDRLNLNFDHLSVVSEENSEGNSITQNEDSSIPIHDLSAFLKSVDVLSHSYLQELIPPLAHFENLNYEQIGGSNVDQHGNILTTAATDADQCNEANTINNRPDDTFTSIETITTPNEQLTVKKQSRLKHFFSPIRKKSVVAQSPSVISQPDVFISNILPSNMYVNPAFHLPETIVKPEAVGETSSPTSSFQTGGNLEELLYDIEALSKDIMNLQTQCTNAPADPEPSVKKPFRSELNLVLSYPNQLIENDIPASPDPNNSQSTPPLPTPMELLNPLSHAKPLLLHNLPSPFPSPSIPASPLTPPMYFKTTDEQMFANDYRFPPVSAPLPLFESTNSILCTVSAPSTPASDRKCIDKFCINEVIDISRSADKKKAKRVSIFNTKDESSDKDKAAEGQEVTANDVAKDADGKEKKPDGNGVANNHHSHIHRNHSHLHPKRRMSLDNTLNSSRHKNHRQICNDPNAKVIRRESNRSSNSFKKRSRSDSAFGGHEDQGGTSMSERYSNSIASSRESSTSLSLKSGKRRISITSYGESKKIPWCGCWGTSCI